MTLVVVVVLEAVLLRLLLGPLESRELFVFSHGLGFIISTLTRDRIVVVGLLILVIIISLPQPDLLGWISMRRYPQQNTSNVILNNFGRPHAPQVEVAVAVIHALTKRIVQRSEWVFGSLATKMNGLMTFGAEELLTYATFQGCFEVLALSLIQI